MYVDDIAVELNGEKNVLEVIRKAGIDMPTLCYHPELSIYGACRMCMFENERGGLDAACSAQPRAGMKVYTNTERLRKYRKNIIELLLANHCRDCNTCEKNGNCKLQQLAKRYDVRTVRFPNTAKTYVDDSSAMQASASSAVSASVCATRFSPSARSTMRTAVLICSSAPPLNVPLPKPYASAAVSARQSAPSVQSPSSRIPQRFGRRSPIRTLL